MGIACAKNDCIGWRGAGSINAQLALIAADTINRAGSNPAAKATTVGNPQ